MLVFGSTVHIPRKQRRALHEVSSPFRSSRSVNKASFMGWGRLAPACLALASTVRSPSTYVDGSTETSRFLGFGIGLYVRYVPIKHPWSIGKLVSVSKSVLLRICPCSGTYNRDVLCSITQERKKWTSQQHVAHVAHAWIFLSVEAQRMDVCDANVEDGRMPGRERRDVLHLGSCAVRRGRRKKGNEREH